MATREDIYQAIRNADAAGDGASVQKLGAYLKTMDATPAPASAPAQDMDSIMAGGGGNAAQHVGNIAAGLVRGAGSIGATILAPVDMARDALNGKGLSLSSNIQRRADMDSALQSMGAQPDSLLYKGAKLGGEVLGTAGAGGLVANGARTLGASAPLVDAIASGGMAGGGNAITRALGGAINGGATAALVDPREAPVGIVAGGLLPGAVKVAGAAGNALADAAQSGSRRLMQSAIKPTQKQRTSGDAETAIDVLLQYGINPTRSGVNKLQGLIDDLNTQIGDKIGSSTATVDKRTVADALDAVRQKFGTQVSPTKDLNAIQGVADDFAGSIPGNTIPVQEAQRLKQGTYSVLKGKYGEAGSAETEAQKGLARGLKEEIAVAVPGVGPLNAEESRLLATLSVAERRALLESNKNTMGLAALAHNPLGWAAFMADRSAAFKSLAARLVNRITPAQGATSQALIGAAGNPLLRTTGLEAVETSP